MFLKICHSTKIHQSHNAKVRMMFSEIKLKLNFNKVVLMFGCNLTHLEVAKCIYYF